MKMNKTTIIKYNVLLFIVILSFVLGFVTANRKSRIETETLTKSHHEEIDTLTQKLTEANTQIASMQQNNITSVKTVYLPSGERIVTKVVDKSTEEKRVTQSVQKSDVINSSVSSSTSEVYQRKVVDNSLPYFKIGLTGLQPLGDNNLAITGGVRIFSLPLFATLQVPINNYRNLQIGCEIEF